MNTVFLEKICRCCLNECDDMTNLFDRVAGIGVFTFESNFVYSDLIYLCTNVRCDLDVLDTNEHIVELPRNVCESCLQELRSAFLFRQKCESSDQLLREQTVGTSSHITEEIVEIEHVIDDRNAGRLYETSANVKEIDPNRECIIIKGEKPVLIREHRLSDVMSNEIEVQIVSVASNDDEQLSHGATEQTITNPTSDITLDNAHLHEAKYPPQLDLVTDTRQRHEEKKYNCTECYKVFLSEKGYKAHKEFHKRKFLCSICGVLFATKQRLKAHASIHSDEKKHQCGDCDKKFATESRLRCHRRTHTKEKPFRCEECGVTFAQGNALRCHKRIHTGEKPYECKVCHKRFTQNTILKTHMTLHTGKKVKCPDCDKLFSRASNLILHRREHTGDRPFRCEECGNRYKQKCHLDRHLDTHFGIKHECEICQKVYSKRWSLKVHMFTHSQIKPHRCSMCDAEFTRRDKFKNHLKSMHGLTDSAADNANSSHVSANIESITE